MASIPACHAGDLGSIPSDGVTYFIMGDEWRPPTVVPFSSIFLYILLVIFRWHFYCINSSIYQKNFIGTIPTYLKSSKTKTLLINWRVWCSNWHGNLSFVFTGGQAWWQGDRWYKEVWYPTVEFYVVSPSHYYASRSIFRNYSLGIWPKKAPPEYFLLLIRVKKVQVGCIIQVVIRTLIWNYNVYAAHARGRTSQIILLFQQSGTPVCVLYMCSVYCSQFYSVYWPANSTLPAPHLVLQYTLARRILSC